MLRKCILFGTASAVASRDRDYTSILVQANEDNFLVDCGSSSVNKMLKMDIQPNSIREIILTHRHIDHIFALPALLHHFILSNRKEPLNIFAPPETAEIIQKMIEITRLQPIYDAFPLKMVPLKMAHKEAIPTVSSIYISSTPTVHLDVQSIGIRFDFQGHSIAYSGDTEPSDNFLELAKNAQTIIHEVAFPDILDGREGVNGHTTPIGAAILAERAGAKRLIMVHFAREAKNWNEVIAVCSKYYRGEIIIGQDMTIYDW